MNGDHEFRRLEAEWDHDKHAVADWFRRDEHDAAGTDPYATQATAAATATVGTTTTQEEHMALNAADLRAFADHIEKIGEEGLAKTEAILANPDTAELFGILHSLTGVNVGPVLTAVKTILAPYVPQAAATAEAAQQAAA